MLEGVFLYKVEVHFYNWGIASFSSISKMMKNYYYYYYYVKTVQLADT